MKQRIQSASTLPQDAPSEPDSITVRKRRSALYGCLLGLALGVFGLLAGRLGQLWIAFDVLSQLTVQFAFMVIAFLFGLLMPRAKVLTACVAFITMVIAYGAWPFWQGMQAKAQPPATAELRQVKVATFNTWFPNETPEAVIEEVARLDADVITLIEFGADKVQLLPKLQKQYPYQADCNSLSYCHLAILSKVPLASVNTKVHWKGPPLMHAMLGGDLAGLNVVAVHTTRFPHFRAQLKQANALAEMVSQMSGPKIVMGDFNATQFSRITQVVTNDAGLVRWTDMPSWPSWSGLPQIAIDHVFTSPGIRMSLGEELGNPSGSDHFPVTMTLSVPRSLLHR